jgi:hypothetical protein
MPIDRNVQQRRARYRAEVHAEGTHVKATIDGDVVELVRPGARAILRVPIDEFAGFEALVVDVRAGLAEKVQIESAELVLPWAPTVTTPDAPTPVDGVATFDPAADGAPAAHRFTGHPDDEPTVGRGGVTA